MDSSPQRKLLALAPGLSLLGGYSRRFVVRDLLAALAVGAMLVPQGLAYAQLAGVRPAAGLWAGIAGMLAYAIFGPSRQLMVGPEAGTAVMTAAAIAPLGLAGEPYAAAAAALAILMGVIMLAGGAARVGAIADFLSRPILAGYVNGVALIIVASQLAVVLGLKREATAFGPQIVEVVRALDRVHAPTLVLSLGAIALLFAIRELLPKIPGAVAAVALGIALSSLLQLESHGVRVVGAIDAGVPRPHVPAVGAGTLLALFPAAVSLALVGYASSVLTSRIFADRNGYEVSANQEFIGQAAANLAAGLFMGFPIAASESRTVVADAARGRTQVVSIAAAAVVLLVLLFLTPIVALLPSAILGAVVIVAAVYLFDAGAITRIWRTRPGEGAIAVITMAGVLFLGILEGILVAVIFSLAALVRRAARPHDAVLGRLEGRPGYHDVEGRPESETLPGLVIYRVDAPLFFANTRFVCDMAHELVSMAQEPVRLFVLDAGGIFDLDTTAAEALAELNDDLEKRGITLAIAEPHAPLREVLRKTGLVDAIGEENVFPTVGAAIRAHVMRSEDLGLEIDWERVDERPATPMGSDAPRH